MARKKAGKGAGMSSANYNQPYASRVRGLGGMKNNSSAKTVSGGNKRGASRKK